MKRLLTSLALTLFSVLGASGIAHAQDSCANAKSSYSSSETLGTASDPCTITKAVTVTGGTLTVIGTSVTAQQPLIGDFGVSVSSTSTNVSVQALTSNSGDITITAATSITGTTISAGNSFGASATGAVGNGSINFSGAINTNMDSLGGNVLLQATNNVATGSINTNGGSASGLVQINANTGGSSAPFTIGSSGQSNGVNGTINVSSTSAGGSNNNFCYQGIFITNGTSSSVGDITITHATDLNVSATTSRAGMILLNAQSGTLSLPAGTINANGASGQMGGVIQLMAKTVTTVSTTVLSATQTSTTGSTHGVIIAAGTVNVAGGSGLQVLADGNGVSSSLPSYADLLPQFGISISSNNNLDDLLID